jgi:putative two-component system response regulator
MDQLGGGRPRAAPAHGPPVSQDLSTKASAVSAEPVANVWSATATWDAIASRIPDDSERPSTILLLERKESNRRLLRATLKTEGHRIVEASSADAAFDLLRHETVDLVILDLMLPEMGGLEFCRLMKARRETRLIPLLVLTSVEGVENEVASLSSGADEFLLKPLHPTIVRSRIRAMLRQKLAIDSLEEAESILFALAQAIEQRDKCTGGHCERLAITSMSLGVAMGLPRQQLLALHRGGYLHDIGKISIPDAILFKAGPLNEEEWAVMRTHTVRGEEICRRIRTLVPVLPIIRSHHERWDGTGYPDGLAGEDVPLLARILQVADVFDALTSVRPYKPALSSTEALNVLEAESRRGWRDPKLVELLRKIHDTAFDDTARELLVVAPTDDVHQSLENMRRALLR